MLHSSTCNLLVWTETTSQSEVWSVVFISFAVTLFLEVLHHPIRGVVKKQNFLQVEKWEISYFHVKALPQLWELCMWLLLWIVKGRTVTSLNYVSDNSRSLAGDSKCRRQSSLIVPCLLLFSHCRFFEVRSISSKKTLSFVSCCKVLNFCLIWLLDNSGFSRVPALKYHFAFTIVRRAIVVFSFANLILVNLIVVFIIQLINIGIADWKNFYKLWNGINFVI